MRAISCDSPPRLGSFDVSPEASIGRTPELAFADLLAEPRERRERGSGGRDEGKKEQEAEDRPPDPPCRATSSPRQADPEGIKPLDAPREATAMTVEALAAQMLRAVSVCQEAGGTSLRLSVEAPRLNARVDLRIKLVGGKVEIAFLPEDPSDRQLIQGAVGSLEQACSERGLVIEPVKVELASNAGGGGDRERREVAPSRPRSAPARRASQARPVARRRSCGTDYVA